MYNRRADDVIDLDLVKCLRIRHYDLSNLWGRGLFVYQNLRPIPTAQLFLLFRCSSDDRTAASTSTATGWTTPTGSDVLQESSGSVGRRV